MNLTPGLVTFLNGDRHGYPAAPRHLTPGQATANLAAFLAKEAGECDACVNGCTCQPGQPGCAHYACWGTPVAGTCPSAKARRDLAGLR